MENPELESTFQDEAEKLIRYFQKSLNYALEQSRNTPQTAVNHSFSAKRQISPSPTDSYPHSKRVAIDTNSNGTNINQQQSQFHESNSNESKPKLQKIVWDLPSSTATTNPDTTSTSSSPTITMEQQTVHVINGTDPSHPNYTISMNPANHPLNRNQSNTPPLVTPMSLAQKPTPLCHYFPNCTNPNCTFSHPNVRGGTECKFGAACTRVGCVFVHPERPTTSPTPTTPAPNTICRFYPNCLNKHCPFIHIIAKPGPETASIITPKLKINALVNNQS